ncbi:MAG: saccharopine dehydrogenase C-terminal domain-containing protein [Hymenobacter sp.]
MNQQPAIPQPRTRNPYPPAAARGGPLGLGPDAVPAAPRAGRALVSDRSRCPAGAPGPGAGRPLRARPAWCPSRRRTRARLDALVAEADIVISMLPAALHPLVARACLRHRRHLATASYVGPDIRALHAEAAGADLVFLMECGLDPGLDHMSAMQVIHELQEKGARLTGFRSYCGGLLAPESEGDNPWSYKFTWNPRNVVLAGQGGPAKYLENGQEQLIPYHDLFGRAETLAVPGHGHFEGYANRDSLTYRELYGLADIGTMLRGTLRRPGYCGPGRRW